MSLYYSYCTISRERSSSPSVLVGIRFEAANPCNSTRYWQPVWKWNKEDVK